MGLGFWIHAEFSPAHSNHFTILPESGPLAAFLVYNNGIDGWADLAIHITLEQEQRMLLKEKTIEVFKYDPETLNKGSHKKICLSCDYCGIEYEAVYKARLKSHQIISKDCCGKCKHKKMQDVNLVKYGVKNQFSRQEIKNQIVENNIEKYGTEYFTQTEEHRIKTKNTNLKKYGVENAMQNQQIRNKQIESLQSNYGVINPSQSKEIQDKIKQTNKEKFGHEWYVASQDSRQKAKDKYGVDNIFQLDEIKNKIKKTNVEKYGVEYPTQNPEVKEKIKQTNIQKYGVECVFQSDEIKSKIKETSLVKYGVENAVQSRLVKEKMRNTMIQSGHAREYYGKTMRELSHEIGKPYTTFVKQVRQHGVDFALSTKTKENGLESVIKNILDKHNIQYKTHIKLNHRMTDFLIEDHKLVLECNGNFWHSDQIIDNKHYHEFKQKAYTDVGYRSLFFREDEIHYKTPIVESIILNQCGMSKRIFARKCTINSVSKSTAKQFFEENHLMGNGGGKSFGLWLNGELVSCIQIRRKKDSEYEISRFCNKLGLSLVGGFSRLLKYVENNVKMDSLITFIDLRYGTGHYLSDFGFSKEKTHLSFKWFKSGKIFNRMEFPGNSGYEEGCSKLWDCGQAKYRKVYN